MPSKVLVVGSGVLGQLKDNIFYIINRRYYHNFLLFVVLIHVFIIGLRTALELLRKNIPIVLRSSHPPIHPSTCSFGAGGLWMPYKCNDPRIDKWSIDTLDELLLSISKNKTHVPIEIVPTLYLKSSHLGNDVDQLKKEQLGLPEWTKDQRLSFQFLTIEMLCRKNQDLNLRIPSEKELLDAGYTHTWLFYPPVVDPPSMLMVSYLYFLSNR